MKRKRFTLNGLALQGIEAEMKSRWIRILEIPAIFALFFGAWLVFTYLLANLLTLLPGQKIFETAAGDMIILGLLVALGLAARLIGKRRFG